MINCLPVRNNFFLVFLLFLLGSCSAYRMRVANDFYEQNAFVDAIPVYKKVLSKQKNSFAMIRLADCLRQNNNTVEAEQWYKKVMNIRQQRPIDKLYYAQVLMTNGKYAEAKTWLEIYSHYTRGDYRLQKLIQSCDSVSMFFKDTNRFQIELLKFNVPSASNFAPAFYRSGIVFSTDMENKDNKNLRNPWNGRNYTDIYYSKKTERGHWLDPELLRGDVNGSYNDGPVSFNKEGTIMYLTRNNYAMETGMLVKNKKNFNVLKVYKSTIEGNGWKVNGEMSFCSDDYSVGHAVVNSSGNSIFFTSDMPWGYGGTDLYVVNWVNGRWSNPQNLGVNINSPGNEMFPFVQNDSVLYFSSDGNYGLGGLDIYQSFYDGTTWSEPVNLGYPVNSSYDDAGFIIDSLDQIGYFSSNRSGGIDKVFSFEKALPTLSISGIVYNANNSRPVDGVRLFLKSKTDAEIMQITKQDGRFYFPLSVNRIYSLSAVNDDFYTGTLEINTFNKKESQGMVQNFNLDPVVLNKSVIWREIGFGKKEWDLQVPARQGLDKLVKIMALNQGLQIELASYTDSRGQEADNLDLTQRRADVCMSYLISKGIAGSRIHAKGFGESRLINNCGNGILCLDEEHAENNRIEIKITANIKIAP